MFDAVLFDLDETLIEDQPLNHHAFDIVALEVTQDEARASALADAAEAAARALWKTLPPAPAEYALRIGHSALEGLWATYDPAVREEAQLQSLMETLRLNVWRSALDTTGEVGDPVATSARWQAVRAKARVYDDADRLLALLRPHTKLAIVTNGVSGLQHQKLDASGLTHWFDVVAVSGELQVGKPDPAIFSWVTERLGVAPSRCAMVGDNPERDILGGRNAGMKTAWLDRGFRTSTQPFDVKATSLRELLPWLRRGSS
jgi:putative hydrolase of the HAD superfamily